MKYRRERYVTNGEKTNNQRCLNPYKSNLITEVLLRI